MMSETELCSSNGLFRTFSWYRTKAPLSRDKRQPTDDRSKKTTFLALGGSPIQDDCPILCIYTGVMLQPPSVQLIFVFVSRAKREFKTRNAMRYLGEILPRIFQLPSAKQIYLKYARGTRPEIWTQVLSEDSFMFTLLLERKYNWSFYDWKSLCLLEFESKLRISIYQYF